MLENILLVLSLLIIVCSVASGISEWVIAAYLLSL